MISLHCTQCKQLLEMDDAFAGGVCRCQFCGTIQTVPSRKSATRDSGKPSKSSSSKALYKKGSPGSPAQPGTGLDELAEIVASSGLARGSLSKPPPARESRTGGAASAKRNPMLPWLIGSGALVFVLLMTLLYLVFSNKEDARPAPPAAAGGARGSSTETVSPTVATPPPAPAGPSFAGVPLPSGSVVYLIDRSQANDDVLDAVKAAVYQSAASLGADRQFQIIFWHRLDEGIVSFPDDGLTAATKEQIDAATKRFEDVVSYGTTDLKLTVQKAAQSRAQAMVIVTAKGFMLEDADVAAVQAAVKGMPVKIHTLALGETDSPALKQIADRTGGQYRAIQFNELRTLTH